MEEETTAKSEAPQGIFGTTDIEKKKDETVHTIENGDGSPIKPPPMTFKRLMVLFSLANLFISSGTAVVLLGAGLSYTVADIGGASSEAWLGVANTLAVAAVSPIAGSLSDLIGRRYAALLASGLVCIGLIVVGTAHRIDVAIGGSALTGVGAGLAETIGAAGLLELAPAKSRGIYMGTAILVDLPFGASLTYAQLYSSNTWRWAAWIPLLYIGLNAILLLIFYHPPPRPNSLGLTKTEIITRIDFIGTLLSIGGIALFLLGLQWGGYNYPWKSAPVITTIVLGGILMIAFVLWENIAPYPMIPARLFMQKRVSILIVIISLVFGANFWSVAAFWPLQALTLYGPGGITISYDLLTYGYGLIAGMALFNWGISFFPAAIREVLTLSASMMTAGVGALATLNPTNAALGRGLAFLAAFGSGGLISPPTTVLTCVCSDDIIGTVSAIMVSVRYIGASVGYAVYFSVLGRKLADVLPTNVATAAIEAGLPPSQAPGFIGALLGSNSTALGGYPLAILEAGEAAVKTSYQEGFKLVYLVSIAFGGTAVLCCLLLGNIHKYIVNRVAVDIH